MTIPDEPQPPASSAPASPAKGSLSSLARHSTIYSIAPILQRAISLFLMRLYTSKLSDAQSGVLQNTDLLFTAVTQIAGVNLMGAVVRFYYDHEEQRDRNCVVSTCALFVFTLAATMVLLGFVFRDLLITLLFGTNGPGPAGENLTQVLMLALLAIPPALLTEVGFRWLQIHRRSTLISTLRVTKSLFEIVLNVWMLVWLEWGVIGFLLATLIGELVTATCLTGWVLWQVKLRFSWPILRPILVYSAPLIAVGVCQMGLNQIDRTLLTHLAPDSDTGLAWAGIYGVAYKLGQMVQIVLVGSIMQIWQPWVFGITDRTERARQLSHYSTYAALLIASGGLLAICFGREGVQLLSGRPDYLVGYRVVPWVVAGYFFFALNGLSQVPLFAAKRTAPMLWTNATGLVVNVLLNLWLIPRFAYVGAAISTLGAFFVLAVLGHSVAARVVEVPFELARLCGIAACILGAMTAALLIDPRFGGAERVLITWGTAIKSGVLVAALGTMWFGVLRADERGELSGWLRRKLAR